MLIILLRLFLIQASFGLQKYEKKFNYKKITHMFFIKMSVFVIFLSKKTPFCPKKRCFVLFQGVGNSCMEVRYSEGVRP